jgi:hypothetical protein
MLTVFVDLSVDLRDVVGDRLFLSHRGIRRDGARIISFIDIPSLAYLAVIQTEFDIGQATALK